MSLSVTVNLAKLITTSQPEARDALSSMLGGWCNSPMFCNALFVDHCTEPCRDTHEERRDAVLHHLLNGMRVLRPDIPSSKLFARSLHQPCTSSMRSVLCRCLPTSVNV